ncbi:hypothetical protein [Microbulbifer sp. JTAC008]|uniref:hypothetical protein n=1 Tax=Microbulbifer sp. JTAC008 TaxID=3243374 RepID=UPI00403974B2
MRHPIIIASLAVYVGHSFARDAQSGKNYEHRRHWIEARIQKLAGTFALDIAAYAVMSSHYHHLMLYIDSTTAKT